MEIKKTISDAAVFALSRLEEKGYKAFAVGGCVRDIIRGKEPHDYDVTTDALPSEIKKIFSDFKTVDIGISHGTVSVIIDGSPIEITTFRRDGEYRDSRHPESVTFTKDIEKDLARRDLTINSMAMSRQGDIVDPFGGKKDLCRRLIRCTGDPNLRFAEDALRILRALRFASVLDFEIEEETAAAIHDKKNLLLNISAERIFTELKKLLSGDGVFRVLTEFPDVLSVIIPEISPSVGFDHMSKYHMYDVYTHTARSVEAAPRDDVLRLTMLLHDIGKPYSFTQEGNARHFKGHPKVSAEIAGNVLRRLKCDRATIDSVCTLCLWHDRETLPDEKHIKRLFSKLNIERIRQLCAVKKADAAAHAPGYRERGKTADEILALAEKIYDEGQCVSLKDLAVNGNDIKKMGLEGADIGKALHGLLELVISDAVPNQKEPLLEKVREMFL